MVTRSKFHIEDPQTLGAAVKKTLDATTIWRQGFVHPGCNCLEYDVTELNSVLLQKQQPLSSNYQATVHH